MPPGRSLENQPAKTTMSYHDVVGFFPLAEFLPTVLRFGFSGFARGYQTAVVADMGAE
ncbi:MAG TPA: hypothetical protein IGQ44_00410 [Geminocystis sp. M7585_C2015_104]|nr:hypothetical protein [Geminocystis sp. M7585_C2015_104]